jgi:ligand-binding SRPBCC domain-containing protein
MPKIELETEIKSRIEICFDLSRSVELHTISTSTTNEKAIAGKTTGLISLGEHVTWQATHFFIRQNLTSKITAYTRPFYFRDEQLKGIFKSIVHDHYFEQKGDTTILKDVFEFKTPFGIIGSIFNSVILKAYLTRLLIKRNTIIKEFAESEKWKSVLNG